MYKVENKNHYYVLDRNNTYYKFDSYEKLLRWLDRYRLVYHPWRNKKTGRIDRVGNSWSDTRVIVRYNRWPLPFCERIREPVEFIVFDAHNRVVNLEYLSKDLEKLSQEKDSYSWRSWQFRRIEKNWLGFRSGPVPHTGYGNKAGGSWYRRPRTTQELRRNSWDYKHARKRRCKKLLPNAWDDLPRHSRGRSWKRQKKRKQWM